MQSLYKLKDIRFGYDDSVVLDIDDLEIEKGSTTALVGPNGSGKTTLLNLLAFLYPPTRGELQFLNQPVSRNLNQYYRRKVGFVHQNPYLLRGTVLHNLEIGLKFHGISCDKRTKKIREVMGTLGIENMAQRPVCSLSGGEAQKVAIGRALVLDPEVLLFDEPFTHLDRRFVEELERLIISFRNDNKRTIVFSTHNQLQAQLLADEIYTLVNGNVHASSHSNLFDGSIDTSLSVFDTGNICIRIPEKNTTGNHLSIEPSQIVLSRHALDSSMRNIFQGRIIAMQEQGSQIRITVEAGERFQVLITQMAFTELALNMGETVWISFKSSSLQVF